MFCLHTDLIPFKPVGNVRKTSLLTLWKKLEKLKSRLYLKQSNTCHYLPFCGGGCRIKCKDFYKGCEDIKFYIERLIKNRKIQGQES